MKRRILSLVLVLTLLIGVVSVLASCGECAHETFGAWDILNENYHQRVCLGCGEETQKARHAFKTDEGTDELAAMLPQTCADCGAKRQVENDKDRFMMEFESKTYPWENTTITMSVGNNSNGQELESGGMAYVAGEWSLEHANYKPDQTVAKVDPSILNQIYLRNQAALEDVNVTLNYVYTGAADLGWGAVMPEIKQEALADNTPDVYYNFIYDMVGASINGSFQNVLDNEYLGTNYATYEPEEDAKGFDWAYMQDMSFSKKAMYLIASDYSFDISRAYMVMPINLALLAQCQAVTGDYDGSGTVDETDFFNMILEGGWTWLKIAEYTDYIKKGDSSNGGYALSGNSIIGVAMSTSSGLSTTAVLYSSNMSIVEREEVDGEWVYSYPSSTPQSMLEAFRVVKSVIGDPGKGSSENTPGGNGGVVLYGGSTSKVATVFAQNRVLVDSSALLGAIERKVYQDMWNEDLGGKGFAVAPVAKINTQQENYRTIVHNIGKVFGISSKSLVADQALAFITHQTINSVDILAEYYLWTLGYSNAVKDENVEVIMGMKEDLRFGIDKVVEDAIGIMYNLDTTDDPFNAGGTMTVGNARWHTFMLSHYDIGDGVSQLYEGVNAFKAGKLTELQSKFLSGETTAE